MKMHRWQTVSILILMACWMVLPMTDGPAANPWPAIRQQRIRQLLPGAMQTAGVDAWLVVCRENANDPLAIHVGGENAGGEAAFLFFRDGSQVRSLAISPAGEATALKDVGLHDRVEVLPRGAKVWPAVAAALREHNPARIAINSSSRAMADGLSASQRQSLERELGPEWSARLVSSEELVVEWLSVKLPAEVDIMRQAAETTDRWLREACRTIIPGTTTDADVARFLKGKMREAGVEDAWAPDQNPNINSGPDRGHSHATDKLIRPGDLIQMDFGIKVHGIWCSDVQRFAYVPRDGESDAPEVMKQRFAKAVHGHRLVLAALKPGVRGYDVDLVQRQWMKEQGSLPVIWGTGHPVGYWAHDLGPALSGGQSDQPPSGDAARLLRPGMVFAWDGFFSWEMEEDGTSAGGPVPPEKTTGEATGGATPEHAAAAGVRGNAAAGGKGEGGTGSMATNTAGGSIGQAGGTAGRGASPAGGTGASGTAARQDTSGAGTAATVPSSPPPKPTKTISVEEMAVVTESGARLLSPPQETLILTGGAKGGPGK